MSIIPNLTIIISSTEQNGIGKNGELAWNIKEDLEHFRNFTMNKKIVMGRKTWNALPANIKQQGGFSNRQNYILTTSASIEDIDTNKTIILHNTDDIIGLAFTYPDEEIVIIGGAELYNFFFEYTNKIIWTRIKRKDKKLIDCDTFVNPVTVAGPNSFRIWSKNDGNTVQSMNDNQSTVWKIQNIERPHPFLSESSKEYCWETYTLTQINHEFIAYNWADRALKRKEQRMSLFI